MPQTHTVPVTPQDYERMVKCCEDFKRGQLSEEYMRQLQLEFLKRYANFPHNPYKDTFLWSRAPNTQVQVPKKRIQIVSERQSRGIQLTR